MVMRYVHANVDEHRHTIDRLPGGNLGDGFPARKISMIDQGHSCAAAALHTGEVAGSIPAAPTMFATFFYADDDDARRRAIEPNEYDPKIWGYVHRLSPSPRKPERCASDRKRRSLTS